LLEGRAGNQVLVDAGDISRDREDQPPSLFVGPIRRGGLARNGGAAALPSRLTEGLREVDAPPSPKGVSPPGQLAGGALLALGTHNRLVAFDLGRTTEYPVEESSRLIRQLCGSYVLSLQIEESGEGSVAGGALQAQDRVAGLEVPPGPASPISLGLFPHLARSLHPPASIAAPLNYRRVT
jgi:hypothetical protein